ncbi:MAG: hypothetical protein AA908_04300 [Chlorobi bacterium NICIL-2]|nr:MAG: hypothetical protein AA908_04300 [Chlorobi bacterium NICIL-2]
MSVLLTNISELATVHAPSSGRKPGAAMNELGIIRNAAMLVEERILWVGTQRQAEKHFAAFPALPRYDCGGRAVLPGFVDSHTHIVFAGSRADEFALRLRGVSYQEIAARGGGIMATVRATRAASEEELFVSARTRIIEALRHGTTTLEVKSGYGLSLEAELKLLRVIERLQRELPVRIVATLLGAHAIPPDAASREAYIEMLCTELIPEVARNGLATFCDVFADVGYFTTAEAERILAAGLDWDLQPKIHADEFADVGAARLAISIGAASADHLLHIAPETIPEFARWRTVATLLPGTAYTLRLPMAPARALIDAGATVALATDCNPGSCRTENMQMIISLATQLAGMTVEEAITAATLHGAAALLREHEIGSLDVGKYADFIVLDSPSVLDLAYHFGTNRVAEVWIGGRRVVSNDVPWIESPLTSPSL